MTLGSVLIMRWMVSLHRNLTSLKTSPNNLLPVQRNAQEDAMELLLLKLLDQIKETETPRVFRSISNTRVFDSL